MQMTKPLELRLKLRLRLEVEVCNGVKAYCTWLENENLINRMIRPLIVWKILVFIFYRPTFYTWSLDMTFIYLILPDIICLNTFLKVFSCSHMTFKLNIYLIMLIIPKELVLYYVLPPFIILKSLHPSDQPVCLKDDFNSRKKSSCTKRLGLRGFYQPLILQVRLGPRPEPQRTSRIKRAWTPQGSC